MSFKRIISYIITLSMLVHCSEVLAHWDPILQLPEPRTGMTAVELNGIAYFIGGLTPGDESPYVVNTVSRLDIENRQWLDDAPPLAIARSNATSVAVNGRIYVIGGYGDASTEEIVSVIEVWWPGREYWEDVVDLLPSRQCARAVVLSNSEILLSGGYLGPDLYDETITSFKIDSLDFRLFEEKANYGLPTPRAGHGMVKLAESIFIFGGHYFGTLDDCYSNQVGELHYRNWTRTDTLSVNIGDMGVSVFYSDYDLNPYALITGGGDHDSQSDKVWLLDKYGKISHYADGEDDLPYARSGHSQISYKYNGKTEIIIAGGVFRGTTEDLIISEVLMMEIENVLSNDRSFDYKEARIPSKLDLMAYPNPSNGTINISIIGMPDEGAKLKLVNMLGQSVYSWEVNSINQASVITWDGLVNGHTAASGYYFLMLEQESSLNTLKLLRLQ